MSADSNIASLVPGKTDAEKAAKIRADITPILEQVCAVVGAARAEGMIVSFNIAPDQFGRVKVQALDITKPL
jgi:hypothetical protein